jgi:hypothetical protein
MSPSLFYPGYYPGQPRVRPARRKGKPNDPIEFDDFSNFVDDTYKMFEGTVNLPKFFLDQIKGDIESALSPTVSPSSNLEIPDELREDLSELPGVQGVKFNLNPFSWANAPKEEAENLVNTVVKVSTGFDPKTAKKRGFLDAINLTDYETDIANNSLWAPLLAGHSVGQSVEGKGKASPVAGIVEGRLSGPEKTPLSLNSLAVKDEDTTVKTKQFVIGYGYVNKPTEVFDKSAEAFKGYMRKGMAESSRNEEFRNMQSAFLTASQMETRRNLGVGWVMGKGMRDIIDARYAEATSSKEMSLQERLVAVTADPKNTSRHIAELEHARKSIEEGLRQRREKLLLDLGTEHGNQSFLTKELGRFDKLGDPVKKQEAYNKRVASYRKSGNSSQEIALIENALGLKDTHGRVTTPPEAGSLGFLLDDIDSAISRARSGISPASAAGEFSTLHQSLSKGILDIKNISDADSKALSIFRLKQDVAEDMKKLDEKMGVVGKALSKGYLYAGVAPERQEEFRLAYEKASGRLSGILASLPNDSPEAMEFRKLVGKYDGFLGDIKKALDGGKPGEITAVQAAVFGRRLSNPGYFGGIRDRYQNKVFNEFISPHTRVGKLIKEQDGSRRLQRLGLIGKNNYSRNSVDDLIRLVESGPEGLANRAWGRVRDRLGFYTPARMLTELVLEPTNYFGMNYVKKTKLKSHGQAVRRFLTNNGNNKFFQALLVDGVPLFTQHWFGISMGGKRIRLRGDKKLAIVEDFNFLISGKDGKKANLKEVLALLNIGGFDDLKGSDLRIFSDMGLEVADLGEFVGDLKKFREWMLNNKDLLGVEGINGIITNVDLAKLEEFFRQIGIRQYTPYLINAAQAYAGILNRVTQAMGKIQAFFGIALGKILKPIKFLKTAIVEGATQLIIAALAAATGGIGFILEIFEPIIRAIVRKLVDWGEAFIKGILKLDLSDLYKEVTNTVSSVIKWFIFLIVGPITLIIFLSFGTVLSAISPVDNSRSGRPQISGICTGEKFEKILGDRPVSMTEGVSFFEEHIYSNLSPVVMKAYVFGEEKTGVPCEILLGIHFMEGNNQPDQSLQDGAAIDITLLNKSARDAGKSLELAMTNFCGAALDTASFEDYICALSYYNGGGGNSQCDDMSLSTYDASLCPPLFFGEDDPYAVNWLTYQERDHTDMSLIFPLDGVKADAFCAGSCPGYDLCNLCPPPIPFERPGAMTVAIISNESL